MMAFLPARARRALRTILLLAACLLVPVFAQQPAWAAHGDRTYRVVDVEYDDVLNVRAGPSVGFPIVGEIPPGGRGVQLIGPCRGWCPVRYRGASGWVHSRYLAAEPAARRTAERQPAPPEKSLKPARRFKADTPEVVAAQPESAASPPAATPDSPRIMSVTPAEPTTPAPSPPVAVATPPPAPAQPAVSKHFRVTGVAANAVLMVRSGPKEEATVVYVYSPRATCIVYVGNCQKPWCQVQYPTEQGPRMGWVDARFLTPSDEACR